MTKRSLGTVLGHVRKLVAAHDAHATDGELLDAFAARQDRAAFTVLVRRHGPMVLNVCRRVLRHQQDAEDAFQATFLILARKAALIRRPRTLAGWLYGAAYRMALSLRRAAARRCYHEGRASPVPAANPIADLAWREVRALLDEEIQRLPEKYRMAFVLCYLEGKSRAAVAGMLGVKEGTLSSRLDQARKCLRRRLARRGVALSAVLAATAVADASAPALPPSLAAATVRAAVALAANKATAGVLSAHVAALVGRGTRAWFLSKTGLVPLIFVACLAAAGAGLIGSQPPTEAQRPGVATVDVSPPARTDVHGDPLPAEALARLGTLRFRPGGFVSSLLFAPDGKMLLAQVTNGTVCAFDLATGHDVRRFRAGDAARRLSPMTRDGRWMIVNPDRKNGRIDAEASLELWDCVAGRKVRSLGKAPYLSGLLSPDGRALAALRYDRVVEVWDPHAGRLLRSWKASDAQGYDSFSQARFTADGKRLLTSHEGKLVRCWDVATGSRLHEFPNVLTTTLFAVAPQGVLAVDGSDYTAKPDAVGELAETRIRLFDVTNGKELRPLVARQKRNALGKPWWLQSGEFAPDGQRLATGSHEGILRLWDVATGKELRSWPYLPSVPWSLAFSPDGRQLAVCDAGTAIRVYDTATGAEQTSPAGNRSGFFQIAFTPDGQTVLTQERHGSTLLAWDPVTGRLQRRVEWPTEQQASFVLTPDGATAFSWASDQVIRTWDPATGREVRRWSADYGIPYFSGLIPSPDGKTLALRFQRPTVILADAQTGKELRRLEAHDPWSFGAAFLPDGRALVTWGADARARVWDLATGRELRQIAYAEMEPPGPRQPAPPGGGGLGPNIYSTAVSPDGRLLAFGSRNRFLVIHDLASGRVVRRVEPLPDSVRGMAFSPDGRTLAWSGPDSPAVRFLEVASGRERHQLAGHRGRVQTLAFAPDGRRLVSGSEDTTALVWDLATPRAGPPADCETAWADLAGTDAARAYRAVRRLAAAPAFLSDRLRPVPAADAARLARLIADLDGDDFTTREKASAELERLGGAAVAACRKALHERPSAEKRRRLEALLEKQFETAWAMTPERLRAGRALEALELSGTPEARQILEKLSAGAAGAWLTEEAKAGPAGGAGISALSFQVVIESSDTPGRSLTVGHVGSNVGPVGEGRRLFLQGGDGRDEPAGARAFQPELDAPHAPRPDLIHRQPHPGPGRLRRAVLDPAPHHLPAQGLRAALLQPHPAFRTQRLGQAAQVPGHVPGLGGFVIGQQAVGRRGKPAPGTRPEHGRAHRPEDQHQGHGKPKLLRPRAHVGSFFP